MESNPDSNLKRDSYNKIHPYQTISLKSNIVGREYKIHITQPLDSSRPGKKYPVLYYLDAWESGELFNMMGPALEAYNEIEPVILAGISFDADDDSFMELRGNDFLPDLENPDAVNGANLFLNFIKSELIPTVETNFPADETDRGLYGYSHGGLFAAWVLKEAPTLFKRIGIGSPSLWRQDYLLLEDQKFLDNIQAAAGLRILATYGSMESEKTRQGVEKLFALLAANKNIHAEKVIFEGDAHGSAYPATCIKALSALYKLKKSNS